MIIILDFNRILHGKYVRLKRKASQLPAFKVGAAQKATVSGGKK